MTSIGALKDSNRNPRNHHLLICVCVGVSCHIMFPQKNNSVSSVCLLAFGNIFDVGKLPQNIRSLWFNRRICWSDSSQRVLFRTNCRCFVLFYKFGNAATVPFEAIVSSVPTACVIYIPVSNVHHCIIFVKHLSERPYCCTQWEVNTNGAFNFWKNINKTVAKKAMELLLGKNGQK